MTQIKQAMILAAGKGTRMRPLTLHTPKPMIDVAGQPLITWHLLALKSAGITNITINCSYLADKLLAALGDGSQYGVNIRWSVEDNEPLETAGGIANALATGKLDNEPFILINGDVWTTYDFSQLVQTQLNDNQVAHLLLVNNPTHNPSGDFAVQNGLARANVDEVQKYTFAGISVMHPQLLGSVDHKLPTPLAPLLIQAMSDNQVTAQVIDDTWVDVGTPERLESVNHFVDNELLAGVHKGQQPAG
ncbi:nucleotidyltransferase family protein [Psychrobacter sp. HD31]|uniref:N-acetylmuramate alpha-1-phosphate uridylyltransferase MurU n=1 Tax=Psychrobacter sp. HD31 TaxID=3112003 RepID=UPI003DA522B5